jgi:hypothetical protein
MERHLHIVGAARPANLPFRSAGLQLADAAERYAAVSEVMREDEAQLRLAKLSYADHLLAFRHAIDEELSRIGYEGVDDA